MGNTIIHDKILRWFLFVALITSITVAIVFAYPFAKQTLQYLHPYSINYYAYKPSEPVVSTVDTTHMPPAIAVPVLMYHGVNNEKDDANTTRKNFIKQMEMLKRMGYQTISIAEYDLFRKGMFVLPAKPIIITFDDGRKDSYYTTDDVFNKLDFKATMFIASARAVRNDPFYLNWQELTTLKVSGRWELEAHGRNSHERILLVKDVKSEEDIGRYLNSKTYIETEDRIETDAEFEKRVESDYMNNIHDLETNLQITPRYYAIPLNDYGQQAVTNHPGAIAFNQTMIKKYFDMAFIVANDPTNVTTLRFPIYNYKHDDPYFLKRIEVKNMSVEDLQHILESQMPVSPQFSCVGNDCHFEPSDAQVIDGTITTNENGIHLTSAEINDSGKLLLGKPYWQDYSFKAEIERTHGKSVTLLVYYKDKDNYVAFGLTGNEYFLRSTEKGITSTIARSFYAAYVPKGPILFEARLYNGKITTFLDGYHVHRNIPITNTMGMAGIKVWDPIVPGQATIHSIDIQPLVY